MLYLADWGSRRLAFRSPKGLVDSEQMRQYNVETLVYPADTVTVSIMEEHTILNIQLNEEEGLGAGCTGYLC